jgi:phosphoglycerate dehydrogenase-like enzyme
MSTSQLTIFCNASFGKTATALLARETGGHVLIAGSNDCSGADVAFGQPDPQQIIASPRLRWVHITTAGYTRYDTDEVRAALRERGIVFTNSSQVYAAPCAQHLLAMMLADARQLLPSHKSQRTDLEWHQQERRRHSYLLDGQTVLLLGMGAIARHLIALLKPFGMTIVAVRRSGQAYPGIEVIGEAQLPQALPQADHVVNILPESESTIGFVNDEMLQRMKQGARFYNVGRGKTVEQEALLEALRSGQLGAAYLDVTDPEPLPPEHPLWTAPNCYITPHTAGGHRGEGTRLVQHFVRNLRAFEAGGPLADRVLHE